MLLCPSLDVQRRDILAGIIKLLRPFVQITDLSKDALTPLSLYAYQDLSYDLNKNVIELILRFIYEAGALTKILQTSAMHQATTTSVSINDLLPCKICLASDVRHLAFELI